MQAKRERYGVSYFMTMGEHFDTVAQLVARLAGR
jgi:hypothetical protein